MIIALSFLILAALMLWLVIYARGPWAAKLALIVAVPLFCFAVWHSLESYKGYPVSKSLPDRSVVISDIVIEPTSEDPGRIYLWLIPVSREKSLLGYRPGTNEPRAYVIPYVRPMHQQLEELRGKPGTPVLERRKTHGGKNGVSGTRFHAYVLPPTVPPKGG